MEITTVAPFKLVLLTIAACFLVLIGSVLVLQSILSNDFVVNGFIGIEMQLIGLVLYFMILRRRPKLSANA